MKETYFTPENIDKKACEMLEKLDFKPKLSFCSERSALIVIDMQRFFLCENSHAFIPSSIAIIPKVKSLISSYYKRNLPVIFTKHVNDADNAGLMDIWWKDLLTSDNPFSDIYPDLDMNKATIIEKGQYDSFYKSDLEETLKAKNVSQIVITGVMTHLCCETTARSAFVRGFEPFFTVDSTATYNEAFHLSSLTNLSHGFSVPVLTSTILEALDE